MLSVGEFLDMAEELPALTEAREIAKALSQSLPTSVSAASLGVRSKTPYNALVVREALIWRMEEVGRGACEAIARNDVVVGALLTRAALEGAALMWELHEVVRTRRSMSAEVLNGRVYALVVGQRLEKDQVQMPNIMTLIDKLDRRLPGTRHRYEHLSEYVHPNWSGVSGAYSRINKEELTTTFGRTQRVEAETADMASNLLAAALSLFAHDYNSFGDLLPEWLSELEPF